jgi:hypothetical protein
MVPPIVAKEALEFELLHPPIKNAIAPQATIWRSTRVLNFILAPIDKLLYLAQPSTVWRGETSAVIAARDAWIMSSGLLKRCDAPAFIAGMNGHRARGTAQGYSKTWSATIERNIRYDQSLIGQDQADIPGDMPWKGDRRERSSPDRAGEDKHSDGAPNIAQELA